MIEQSTVFYRAADAHPEALADATIAVLGYGNLGRSVALNLRDSGCAVVVGNRNDEYGNRAARRAFPSPSRGRPWRLRTRFACCSPTR